MTDHPGLLITFEGPDGSGKTTQLRRLAVRLREEGFAVVETAEPGGTSIGRQIRRILLDPENRELRPAAEMLLMFAARAQSVEECILPALGQDCIVLSDRFTDSTLVYQGAGRGVSERVIRTVDQIACHGLIPDLTILLDIDTATGLGRARARNRNGGGPDESRFDDESMAFHQRVRTAYLQLAAADPERVRLVDGDASEDVVEARVWDQVAPSLGKYAARSSSIS